MKISSKYPNLKGFALIMEVAQSSRSANKYAKTSKINGINENAKPKISVTTSAKTKASGTKWKSEIQSLLILSVLPIQRPFEYFCLADEKTVGLEN